MLYENIFLQKLTKKLIMFFNNTERYLYTIKVIEELALFFPHLLSSKKENIHCFTIMKFVGGTVLSNDETISVTQIRNVKQN